MGVGTRIIKIKSGKVGNTRLDLDRLFGQEFSSNPILVRRAIVDEYVGPSQIVARMPQLPNLDLQPSMRLDHYTEAAPDRLPGFKASSSVETTDGTRGPVVISLVHQSADAASRVRVINAEKHRELLRPDDALASLMINWAPQNAALRRLRRVFSEDIEIGQMIKTAVRLLKPDTSFQDTPAIIKAIERIDSTLVSEEAISNPLEAFRLLNLRTRLKEKLGRPLLGRLIDYLHFWNAMNAAGLNSRDAEKIRDHVYMQVQSAVNDLPVDSKRTLLEKRNFILELLKRSGKTRLEIADYLRFELGKVFRELGNEDRAKETYMSIAIEPFIDEINEYDMFGLPRPTQEALSALKEMTSAGQMHLLYEELFNSTDVRVKAFALCNAIYDYLTENRFLHRFKDSLDELIQDDIQFVGLTDALSTIIEIVDNIAVSQGTSSRRKHLTDVLRHFSSEDWSNFILIMQTHSHRMDIIPERRSGE